MNYVEEIKRGNKLAFEEVYYKYHERFYFYVLKKTASEDLAEETVQMAYMRIWEKRTQLSDDFPIEVQLARVARSIMIDTLRRKAAERKALDVVKQTTDAAIAGDPAADRQLMERVTETIESLPPECRKIYILSREGGLTYSEIAERLSISPKTVENQVSKALKTLRKAVALSCIFHL
ncbi:MAG: sigma-70 family RNA polymerase sigma factor [Bacteroidetes bacterium]|nr:sigma-70 family RNA polymerase sigma factor [Bacteroidota bacterium]